MHHYVRVQLEFYFSDANLRRDRFLRQCIDASSDGWVTLDTLLTFNKLKKLGATEPELAAAAASSAELEAGPDGTTVRRVVPLPPADPAQADSATVYVEGFGESADIDKLTSFFSSFGSVVYVSLPRLTVTKKPKGFAFVEFDSDAAAEAVVTAAAPEGGRLKISDTGQREALFSYSNGSDRGELRVMGVPLWKSLRTKYNALVKSHRALDAKQVEAADKGLAAVLAWTRVAAADDAAAFPDGESSGGGGSGGGGGSAERPPEAQGVLVHVFGVPAKATKAWIRKQVGHHDALTLATPLSPLLLL
jgi:hypothetical protein